MVLNVLLDYCVKLALGENVSYIRKTDSLITVKSKVAKYWSEGSFSMKIKNIQSILVLLVLSFMTFSSHALRSTDFEAYTDPDFVDYKFTKVMLVVEGSFAATKMISERLQKEFSKRDIDLVDHKRLFPPTREWTPEARNDALTKNLIDAVLVVTPGASAVSTMPGITQTYGRASGNYNNNTGSFSGSGTSTSYHMLDTRSSAEFSAVLLDVKTSRIAWYADILTSAGGAFFVGTAGDAKAVAKGIIKGLVKNDHLKK